LAVLLGGYQRVTAGLVDVNFSYTFGSGQTLSGTVRGDLPAGGDLVTNLTALNAVYSGVPGSPFTFLSSFGDLSLSGLKFFEFVGFVSFPDTVTTQSNFGFSASNEAVLNAVTVGTFLTDENGFSFPAFPLEAEQFNADGWSASASPVPSVPEPSSLVIAMIGGVGLVVVRRRRQRLRPV